MAANTQPNGSAVGQPTPASQIWPDLPGRTLAVRLVTGQKDESGNSIPDRWEWRDAPFQEVLPELNRTDMQGLRVISVESNRIRAQAQGITGSDRAIKQKDQEALEVFVLNPACRNFMTQWGFPAHLLTATWAQSNGFAGSAQTSDGHAARISWFRVLAKIVKPKYYWHEMTFFIHQLEGSQNVTVLCFEVPDNGPSVLTPAGRAPTVTGRDDDKTNFLNQLAVALGREPPKATRDWRYIQSLILREVVMVADRAVWGCSNAVRDREKMSDQGIYYDFVEAHNLLRHTLHNTEVLTVAHQNLLGWLETYRVEQKRAQRIQLQSVAAPPAQQAPAAQNPAQTPTTSTGQQTHTAPQSTGGNNHDDLPLPAETYHSDVMVTLQLLSNLIGRSASNDARLRNQIGLAFNLVNQRDAQAMKAISIITLFFLPATFASTFFSMSFFNFQPPYEKRWGVSPWVALYCGIAVFLTIVTMIFWYGPKQIWERVTRPLSPKAGKQD